MIKNKVDIKGKYADINIQHSNKINLGLAKKG
jgi:hypothetical protein